jgi:Trypsin
VQHAQLPTAPSRHGERMRRLGRITALLAAVAAIGATYAGAITNGHPDGNDHPYTGVLVSDYETPGYKQRFCSGTLVAPRVVVTAAHCLESDIDPSRIWVSFDPVYHPGISTIYRGTMVTAVDPNLFVGNSGYAAQYGNSDLSIDIAVVHLDVAPGITPAKLPTAGLLSSLNLSRQTFTAVGYGRTRDDKTKGQNAIEANFDPDVRNVATQGFRSLQAGSITLSQNPSRGYGGWCYGDSGSGNFLGDSDVMASLAIEVDSACRATGRGGRLDTEFARQFLASQGVPLP